MSDVATPVAAPAPSPAQGNTAQTPNAAPVEQLTPEQQMYELVIGGAKRKFSQAEVDSVYETAKGAAEIRRAAHQKFEEAAKERQALTAQKEQMRKNFIKAISEDKDLGLTRDEIRQQFEKWYKNEFIDPESQTPEQRELAELKKWRAEQEERLSEEKKTAAEKLQEQEDAQMRDQLQNEMISMLDKSGLPRNRFTVARLAYWTKQNLANGYDAPADVIIQQVKDERVELIKGEISSATPAQLVELFGKEFVDKFRKYDLEQLNNRFAKKDQPAQPKKDSARRNGRSMAEVDQYFNSLRQQKI